MSRGIPRMNCITRKMSKALPKNAGTVSGRKVPTQPSWLKSTKRGIIITWPGSIMVTIMHTNQKFRPGKCSRARPKATSAADSAAPMVDSPATMRELRKYTPKLSPAKPRQPFT